MNVIRYHRVSTHQQNLQRQASATEKYVEQHFPDADVRTEADADTGTNTDREGYHRVMNAVEAGEVDAIVVKDLSRVARSVRDLMRTVDKVREHGVELHFIDDPVKVRPNDDDPTQELLMQVMAAFAEFEAKITRQRIREGIAARQESDDYHHGPAPLGFDKEDGMLIEADDYDRVCAVLEMVQHDELSKRKAAKRLTTSRATIGRALDRPELYGLEKTEATAD